MFPNALHGAEEGLRSRLSRRSSHYRLQYTWPRRPPGSPKTRKKSFCRFHMAVVQHVIRGRAAERTLPAMKAESKRTSIGNDNKLHGSHDLYMSQRSCSLSCIYSLSCKKSRTAVKCQSIMLVNQNLVPSPCLNSSGLSLMIQCPQSMSLISNLGKNLPTMGRVSSAT